MRQISKFNLVRESLNFRMDKLFSILIWSTKIICHRKVIIILRVSYEILYIYVSELLVKTIKIGNKCHVKQF